MTRFALSAAVVLPFALPARAAPRDEALRLAPADVALVAVAQNLRDHAKNLSQSPFAGWFPTSALGKQLLGGDGFKRLTDGATPIFNTLGITPSDLLTDVIGDAVVFAYSPGGPGDPKGERSVILVRPRKPDTLAGVIEKLNKAQTDAKELKAVVEHKHAGAAYFERQKSEGASEFYAFADGVFVFSQSEAEVKAALDRAASAPKDKPPELVARLTKLGAADAALVLLVNPRALDAELAAKLKGANANERPFLTKFAQVWAATEAAAVYLTLDTGLELGVSLRFNADKLPAGAKGWLVGPRAPSAVWGAIPADALLAVAGRVKPTDLLDLLGALNAGEGKPSPREVIEQTLGPIVGKDKLPAVLDALGPDWGAWVVPGAKGDAVPAVVAAVKVQGANAADAAKSLTQALEYGFQVARIAYNAKHQDQIELKEEKDGDAVIKSLTGDGFPAGFRPCFALKGGYLLLSTSPDALKAFKPPAGEPKAGGDVPLARFSGTATRAYLTANAAPLAKFLATAGAGAEKELAEQLAGLAAVLEPLDTVELLARGDDAGAKLMLRVKTAKPLK
jgi:hypothetical protein